MVSQKQMVGMVYQRNISYLSLYHNTILLNRQSNKLYLLQ